MAHTATTSLPSPHYHHLTAAISSLHHVHHCHHLTAIRDAPPNQGSCQMLQKLHNAAKSCTMLPNAAPCCLALHRAAPCCTVLPCAAPCCLALHRAALRCTVLPCAASPCTGLHHATCGTPGWVGRARDGRGRQVEVACFAELTDFPVTPAENAF